MPVSLSRDLALTCPACGHGFQARVWVVVHAEERPDLVEQARQGTLHTAACPACGHKTQVDAPVLLYFPRPPEGWSREERDPVALFAPARRTTAEEDRQDLQALLEHLAQALGRSARVPEGSIRLIPVPPDALAAVVEQGPNAVGGGGRGAPPWEGSWVVFSR